MLRIEEVKISIVGLGYVGLPLAVEFGKKYQTVGLDINQERVAELNSGVDATLEVADQDLQAVLQAENQNASLQFSTDIASIKEANFHIVTVPTPTDKNNRPVLTPLYKASETVGKALKKGDVVVYESTVYPGVTEEECIPVLEKVSGLKFNQDFFVGYSPERINPGDKERTLTKILKITSGSNAETAQLVDEVYNSIITAGTYMAPSIKVAESAKVIENSQRDMNIAFVNELARIFNTLGIDTQEVLKAAGTKWNFLPFQPGLVGGHCIGVDPYYIAQKAQEHGYFPELILASRRLNDKMATWVAADIVKVMIKKGCKIMGAKVLILGITFKENCPDIRNTKIVDLVTGLEDFGCEVDVYDPWADQEEVKHEYQLDLCSKPNFEDYKTVVHAVSHTEFQSLDFQKIHQNAILYDLKGVIDREFVDARL